MLEAGISMDGPRDLTQAFPPLLLDVWKRQGIPNAAVGVGLPEARDLYVGYANPDFDPEAKIDEDTPFILGSISKVFVAIAVMQLAESGALDIDDSVFSHFKVRESREFHLPVEFQNVTIRDLLTHSGALAREGGLSSRQRIDGVESLVEALPDEGILVNATPGDRIRYSNYAYQILAELVLRKVRRRNGTPDYTWAEYVHDHITEPLGMRHTRSTSGWTDFPPELAPLYEHPNPYEGRRPLPTYEIRNDETEEIPRDFLAEAFPAACDMVGTAKDLVTLGRFLLGERSDRGVLRDSTIQRMVTEVFEDSAERRDSNDRSGVYPPFLAAGQTASPKRFGLGIDVFSAEDPVIVGHSGYMAGGAAALVVDLDNRHVYAQCGPGDSPALGETVLGMLADAKRMNGSARGEDTVERYRTRIDFNRSVAALYKLGKLGRSSFLLQPVGDRLWEF